ncbi:CHAT domain-containing WD40 repeat protein [Streptomyces sp. NPDC001070]
MEALDFHVAVHAAGDFQIATVRSASGATALVQSPLLTADHRVRELLERLPETVTLAAFPGMPAPGERPARELGELLFSSLFDAAAANLLMAGRDQAEREQRHLRVVLLVQTPSLARLPWEYLYDASAGEFLALEWSLVREPQVMTEQRPLTVKGPLHVLGMTAVPPDVARLSVEQEQRHLSEALGGLVSRGLVELSWVAGPTWRDLQTALSRTRPHVLHFMGHGVFDPATGRGALVLGDETNGTSHRMSAGDFALLLHEHTSLRLVVLNACATGRADPLDPFSGVAAALLHKRVPAVVAMQFAISDRAATEFSRTFYEQIAEGRPVHHGVTAARRAVRIAQQGSLEWGTPMLWLRSSNGLIFDLGTPPANGTAGRRTPPDSVLAPEPASPPGAAPPPQRAGVPDGTVALERRRPRLRSPQAAGFRRLKTVRSPWPVHSVSLGPHGKRLAIGGSGRTVRLIGTADGREVHTFRLGIATGARMVVLSPDGSLLAASSRRSVRIWNTYDGTPRTAVDLDHDVISGPRRIAFSPDGKLLATSGLAGAGLWSAEDGRSVHRLAVPGPVTGLCFSPNGRQLVTIGDDGRILLWDTRGRLTPVRDFTLPGTLSAVAFSPDGEHVVTAGEDCTVRFWTVPDGESAHEMSLRSLVHSMCFSPDGRWLAVGCDDGRARFWPLGVEQGQLKTGRPRVVRHDRAVTSVAISPDSLLAATGSTDHNVQIWSLRETTDG